MATRNNYVKNAVSPILSVKKCSSTQKCRCKKSYKNGLLWIDFKWFCVVYAGLSVFFNLMWISLCHTHTHSSCRPTLDRASNKWTIYLSNDCRFIHRNPPIPKQRHRSTLCVHCRNSQIKHTTDVSACLSHNECVLSCCVFIIGVTVLAVSFHWPKFMQKFLVFVAHVVWPWNFSAIYL